MSRVTPLIAGLAIVAGAAALSACSDDNNNPPAGGTTFTVANNSFSPASITINSGESVRFLWASGAAGHNVTPASGSATALPISPGSPALLAAPQDFTIQFPSAGTYRFFCSAHGANPSPDQVTGMSGSVIVQ